MQIEKEFTLLHITKKNRTTKDNKNQDYLIIDVLDEELNPCKFFVFNEEIVNQILNDSANAKALQKVLIKCDFTYNGSLWNCNLIEMLFTY